MFYIPLDIHKYLVLLIYKNLNFLSNIVGVVQYIPPCVCVSKIISDLI